MDYEIIKKNNKLHLVNDYSIKLILNIDKETEKINVQLETTPNILWTTRYNPKKTIRDSDINRLVEQLKIPSNLVIHPMLLDQSRTHPRYSDKYNKDSYKLQQLIYNNYNSNHYMLNNGNLAYIGDAFVNFVVALMIYNEYGYFSTAGELTELATEFKSNKFLAQKAYELEWAPFLAHNNRDIHVDTRKGEKAYADMMEGLIGCLYVNNGLERLPELFEVVKNMIMPTSELNFINIRKDYKYTRHMMIVTGFIGFNIGLACMYAIFYFTDII